MGPEDISQTLWEAAQALGLNSVSLLHISENPKCYSPPLYIAQDNSDSEFSILAIGKGHSADQRLNSTLGEYIERKLMVNRKADLRKSLSEVLGNDHYLSQPTIATFEVDMVDPLSWVSAKDYVTNEKIYVHRPIRVVGEKGLYNHTSNGCALDPSLECAKSKSIFEVIERDTVLSHWIGGFLPIARIAIPHGFSHFYDNAKNDNFDVSLYLLSQAHGIFTVLTVYRSVCEQPDFKQNGFIVGCCTSSRITDAVMGAIAEVQQIVDLVKINNENLKVHPHILSYMHTGNFFKYFNHDGVRVLPINEIQNLEVEATVAIDSFVKSLKEEGRRITFTQDYVNNLWMTQFFVQGYLNPILTERDLCHQEIFRVEEIAKSRSLQISKLNFEPCPLG